jgi:hypothetical protein
MTNSIIHPAGALVIPAKAGIHPAGALVIPAKAGIHDTVGHFYVNNKPTEVTLGHCRQAWDNGG